jgi:Uma2 family endonuclease
MKSMATVPANYISPEEYLERERKAEAKSEYIRGEIFAMAGASIRHAVIISNLVLEIGVQLRSRNCNVFSTDLRLAVNPAGMYTYPDVMVVCGDPVTIDNQRDTIMNPVVIIEVLSDSTKNYDRGQKFQYYRMLPSLKEYVTVGQDEVHLERHIRGNAGEWILTEFGKLEDVVELPSIGVSLALSDVYRRIDFTSQ